MKVCSDLNLLHVDREHIENLLCWQDMPPTARNVLSDGKVTARGLARSASRGTRSRLQVHKSRKAERNAAATKLQASVRGTQARNRARTYKAVATSGVQDP